MKTVGDYWGTNGETLTQNYVEPKIKTFLVYSTGNVRKHGYVGALGE